MILFVVEGKRDDAIFESIQKLFFPKEKEPFVCVYKSDIYSLYSKIKKYDLIGGVESVDTVSVLKDILLERGDLSLVAINPSQISEIFLFFDYDFQNSRLSLEENNRHLEELISFFNDETGNGKLYINYPMVESVRYTKELPDEEYYNYTICRKQCKQFKNLSAEFSHYPSLDYILLANDADEPDIDKTLRYSMAKQNWLHLIKMNVAKANYICNENNDYPVSKSDITQLLIFGAQCSKYVCKEDCIVSILCAFPIFIYEYLKVVE